MSLLHLSAGLLKICQHVGTRASFPAESRFTRVTVSSRLKYRITGSDFFVCCRSPSEGAPTPHYPELYRTRYCKLKCIEMVPRAVVVGVEVHIRYRSEFLRGVLIEGSKKDICDEPVDCRRLRRTSSQDEQRHATRDRSIAFPSETDRSTKPSHSTVARAADWGELKLERHFNLGTVNGFDVEHPRGKCSSGEPRFIVYLGPHRWN